MWLDAFIYLPLVILGIHRVMDLKRPKLLFISYLLLFYPVLYGFYDWRIFFLIFYRPSIDKLVRI